TRGTAGVRSPRTCPRCCASGRPWWGDRVITVLVPGALRTDCGGEARLAVEPCTTLGGVLDEVDRRYPRLGRRIRDEQGELPRYGADHAQLADDPFDPARGKRRPLQPGQDSRRGSTLLACSTCLTTREWALRRALTLRRSIDTLYKRE